MIICVRDPATDKAVRLLAKIRGKTIREAVENELRKERRETLSERIDAMAQGLSKFPKTGLEADKAFYDELSGDA